MVTENKELQPLKAESSIDVTELGMVTDSKLLQLKKALLPMFETPFSIITVFIEFLRGYHGAEDTKEPPFQ